MFYKVSVLPWTFPPDPTGFIKKLSKVPPTHTPAWGVPTACIVVAHDKSLCCALVQDELLRNEIYARLLKEAWKKARVTARERMTQRRVDDGSTDGGADVNGSRWHTKQQ